MKTLIIVFGLVGIGLLAGGAIAFQDTRNLIDVAIEVPGTVVDYTTSTSDGSTSYSPVYEFRLDGETFRHETSVATSGRPTMGATETLLVDPDDPTEVKPKTFIDMWFLPVLLGGMGLLFTGLSVVFVIVSIARGRSGGSSSFAESSASWDTPSDSGDEPRTTVSASDDDAPTQSGPFL